MSNGLTPQKNKQELTIEKDKNQHRRDEDFKNLIHFLRKKGIITALIIGCVGYIIILAHNISIGNWDFVTTRGEQFSIALIAYLIGITNKKTFDTDSF